ncbi:hypothetical protein V8B55DRAFT_1554514, partial [Mucor lusitanicus]
MTDLNWCTYCDNAISQNSNALYCSEKCLRLDTLHLLKNAENSCNQLNLMPHYSTKYLPKRIQFTPQESPPSFNSNVTHARPTTTTTSCQLYRPLFKTNNAKYNRRPSKL